MDSKFKFVPRNVQDVLFLDCDGYINQTAGEALADYCLKEIEKGSRKVVLNMEKSTVINSVGVSIIIEIIEKLQQVNGQIGYYNLAPIVAKTFKIMGLTDYSTIYQSEQEALQHLTRPS